MGRRRGNEITIRFRTFLKHALLSTGAAFAAICPGAFAGSGSYLPPQQFSCNGTPLSTDTAQTCSQPNGYVLQPVVCRGNSLVDQANSSWAKLRGNLSANAPKSVMPYKLVVPKHVTQLNGRRHADGVEQVWVYVADDGPMKGQIVYYERADNFPPENPQFASADQFIDPSLNSKGKVADSLTGDNLNERFSNFDARLDGLLSGANAQGCEFAEKSKTLAGQNRMDPVDKLVKAFTDPSTCKQNTFPCCGGSAGLKWDCESPGAPVSGVSRRNLADVNEVAKMTSQDFNLQLIYQLRKGLLNAQLELSKAMNPDDPASKKLQFGPISSEAKQAAMQCEFPGEKDASNRAKQMIQTAVDYQRRASDSKNDEMRRQEELTQNWQTIQDVLGAEVALCKAKTMFGVNGKMTPEYRKIMDSNRMLGVIAYPAGFWKSAKQTFAGHDGVDEIYDTIKKELTSRGWLSKEDLNDLENPYACRQSGNYAVDQIKKKLLSRQDSYDVVMKSPITSKLREARMNAFRDIQGRFDELTQQCAEADKPYSAGFLYDSGNVLWKNKPLVEGLARKYATEGRQTELARLHSIYCDNQDKKETMDTVRNGVFIAATVVAVAVPPLYGVAGGTAATGAVIASTIGLTASVGGAATATGEAYDKYKDAQTAAAAYEAKYANSKDLSEAESAYHSAVATAILSGALVPLDGFQLGKAIHELPTARTRELAARQLTQALKNAKDDPALVAEVQQLVKTCKREPETCETAVAQLTTSSGARSVASASTEATSTASKDLSPYVTREVGNIVPIEEAQKAYKDAGQQAYKQLQDIVAQRSGNVSQTEQKDLFEKLYNQALTGTKAGDKSAARGGLLILDTPVEIPGVPKQLYDRINIDHHGMWYNANTPFKNTTIQTLKTVDDVMNGAGSLAEKQALLKQYFKYVSTDNLGDGGWSLWIAQHLDQVEKDPQLRKTIRAATAWEDFGAFGTRMEARAGPEQMQAIDLQKAIFGKYSELAEKYGAAGDRFGAGTQITPDKQVKLAQEAVDSIDQIIKGGPSKWHELAQDFDSSRGEAAKLIDQSHQKIVSEVTQATATSSDKGAIDTALSKAYVYDSSQATKEKGVFSSWAGSAGNHDQALQVNFSDVKATDGTPRQGFTISVPNGRTSPINLSDVARDIRNEERAKGLAHVDIANAIGSRGKDLAFSFGGTTLSKEEILAILGKELKQAETQKSVLARADELLKSNASAAMKKTVKQLAEQCEKNPANCEKSQGVIEQMLARDAKRASSLEARVTSFTAPNGEEITLKQSRLGHAYEHRADFGISGGDGSLEKFKQALQDHVNSADRAMNVSVDSGGKPQSLTVYLKGRKAVLVDASSHELVTAYELTPEKYQTLIKTGKLVPQSSLEGAEVSFLRADGSKGVVTVSSVENGKVTLAMERNGKTIESTMDEATYQRGLRARPMTDDERIAKAEEVAGFKFTYDEKKALLKAHGIGEGPIYPADEITAKGNALRTQERFRKPGLIRQFQEQWITGDPLGAAANQFEHAGIVYHEGDVIKVARSGGATSEVKIASIKGNKVQLMMDGRLSGEMDLSTFTSRIIPAAPKEPTTEELAHLAFQAEIKKPFARTDVKLPDGRQNGWVSSIDGDMATISFPKDSYGKRPSPIHVKASELQPTDQWKSNWVYNHVSQQIETKESQLLEAARKEGRSDLFSRQEAKIKKPDLMSDFDKNRKGDEDFIAFQKRRIDEKNAQRLVEREKSYAQAKVDFPKGQQVSFSKFTDETAFDKDRLITITYQDADGNLHSINAKMVDNKSVPRDGKIRFLHNGKEEELNLRSVSSVKNRETGTTWVAPENPDVTYGKIRRPTLASVETPEPIHYDSASPEKMVDAIKRTPMGSKVRVHLKDGETIDATLLDWKQPQTTVGVGENMKFRDPAKVGSPKVGFQWDNGQGGVQSRYIDPDNIATYDIVEPKNVYSGVDPFIPN